MDNQLAAEPIRARGGVLLTLAVLSFLVFGPLTGVPVWIMANQDIKEVRNGALADPHGLVGVAKVIAIVGTFCSPLWLILLFVVAEVTILTLGAMLG